MVGHDVPPIVLENHFSPGFRAYPAVHVGSQTMALYRGSGEDQAWETLQLAAAFSGDVAVVRGLDHDYRAYWQALAGPIDIIDLQHADPGEFLTRALLDTPDALVQIRTATAPETTLAVFFPTPLEAELASRLTIPLHGSPVISAAYGTKSGIRNLAGEACIPMAPGFVCRNLVEVEAAMRTLGRQFEEVVIKHDLATGGLWSLSWNPRRGEGLQAALDRLCGTGFTDGTGPVVIEGWLKSSAVICAHVEIWPDRAPIICAGWQQVMDEGGRKQIGAAPLRISPVALASFREQVVRLAAFLQTRGALGSYGPDFLIVGNDEENGTPDTSVLLELNARAPATAYALEIVKRVRGRIGAEFFSRHLNLSTPVTFGQIAYRLDHAGLLIRHPDPAARGVVPYNVGLLPWGTFDVVAMADSWPETTAVMREARDVLGVA